jgi:hypothetical protein
LEAIDILTTDIKDSAVAVESVVDPSTAADINKILIGAAPTADSQVWSKDDELSKDITTEKKKRRCCCSIRSYECRCRCCNSPIFMGFSSMGITISWRYKLR